MVVKFVAFTSGLPQFVAALPRVPKRHSSPRSPDHSVCSTLSEKFPKFFFIFFVFISLHTHKKSFVEILMFTLNQNDSHLKSANCPACLLISIKLIRRYAMNSPCLKGYRCFYQNNKSCCENDAVILAGWKCVQRQCIRWVLSGIPLTVIGARHFIIRPSTV